MSAEKDNLFDGNDEAADKFDYYYQGGRVSPSSWDSNEEQSDVEGNVRDNDEKLWSDSNSAEIPPEDRRQSLARVRRRSRSGDSPVNSKGKDSSESCDESIGYSAKLDQQTYREVMSSDGLPNHRIWNGWESDEIVSDDPSPNQTKYIKYGAVVHWKSGNHPEYRTEVDKPYGKELSKIMEVEETKSKSSGTPPSAVSSRFQTHYNYIEYPSDDGYVNNQETVVDDGNFREKDDSDDSELWRKVKSNIKDAERTISYEDSQYVNQSLHFIFNEGERRNQSHGQEDGESSDEKEIPNWLTTNNGEFESEACNEDGKNLEVTPKQTDFGMKNAYTVPQYFSESGYSSKDGMTERVPRSGREVFLLVESSKSCNFPTIECDNKRLREKQTVSESRMRSGLSSSISGLAPANNQNWIRRFGDKEGENNDSKESSPSSFGSKIILNLELSDNENEEKCTNIGRRIFGDPAEYVDGGLAVKYTENLANISPKHPTAANWKTTEIGLRQSMDSEMGNHYIYTVYDRAGAGDSKWNPYDGNINRSDESYEKPVWAETMTNRQSSNRGRNNFPNGKVFWIDFSENPEMENRRNPEIRRKRESRLREATKIADDIPRWESQFATRNRTKYRRIKSKKRKWENVFAADDHRSSRRDIGMQAHSHHGLTGRNRLIDNMIKRKDSWTRGKKWIQTIMARGARTGSCKRNWLSSTRKISGSGIESIDCFCSLFKQFVNIFTVSRDRKK